MMYAEFERHWKEAVMAHTRYNPGIFLKRRGKIKRKLSHEWRCLGPDSEEVNPE
jgi:hypothetical protein